MEPYTQFIHKGKCQNMRRFQWPPIKSIMNCRIWAASEYEALRERLRKPTVTPTVFTGHAKFLTVDVHEQVSFLSSPETDDKLVAKEGVEPNEGRDGLAHVFSAGEGTPIPSELAAVKSAYFVFEVPKNFLQPVIKGVKHFLVFVFLLNFSGC